MSENSENRRRAFAEVVTIDAWHDGFSREVSSVDLYVDVVFGTARVGGEAESPVRFRLSVRQADVVVVIPESEPVTVDKRAVSRDSPELQGRITDTFERSARGKVKGSMAGSISESGFSGHAAAELEAEAAIAASNKLEVTGTLQLIVVTQSKTPDGHYRWSLKPATSDILQGRPWNADKQPRLKLIDQRTDRARGIPPSVRVEVRCRREDILITDIEIKNESMWETVKNRAGFKNRMAAAEAYIRDRLAKEGLEVTNIEELFGQLTLGSTIAQP